MTVINTEERIQILADLVAIQSVNDNETEVAQYLNNLFEKHNISSTILHISGNRSNLVAEIGTGSPVIAVTGHMDVVDSGNLTAWDSDPFTMTEKHGNLFGRGTNDMKSGLAALVISMIELNHAGKPTKGTIRLLATAGEEVGESGSRAFFENGYMEDASALLVAEPSGFNIGHAQKGSMDLKIISKGITVHSSIPKLGYNAINSLINVISEANKTFSDPNNPKSELFGPMDFNADVITGGTQVNSIPDYAEAEINVRTVPEYNNEMVLTELNKIISRYNSRYATEAVPVPLMLEVLMNELPVQAQADSKFINYAREIATTFSSTTIPVLPLSGITDASNLVRDKPSDFLFLVFGPGDARQAHVINEHISKDMYLEFIEIYIQLFSKMLD
ncbi:ArgE/DapE family deacylase [Companilactobacillus metriopterae]|uniref:ArgE/DapE family deacylase n=1 Tax=Companilactobacillus metriopterae TaxID=1909267 RepID=UPI00100B0FE9|nr:ArgE/DapE family deacylase [Companilactobacillus metriopterae]